MPAWRQITPERMRTMKLEELLGAELYAQVKAKIDAVNGKEADKTKHIRYTDLSEGSFVSKEKYTALETEHQANQTKLTEADALIEQLKQAAKDDQGAQDKITAYQTKVTELEGELEQTKLNAAIRVGLLNEQAVDADYLAYKLKEKNETLELDEAGNIKGWADKVAALKTQLPEQFKTKGKENFQGFRPLDKEGNPTGSDTLTKADILKKPYGEQLKLYQENAEAYNEIMKG